MTVFGYPPPPPLTSHVWIPLPFQSTNFSSHLLSYNKALINQLLGSMLNSIQTLALCLTPFRPCVRAAVGIFSALTVNNCLLVHIGNMVVSIILIA